MTLDSIHPNHTSLGINIFIIIIFGFTYIMFLMIQDFMEFHVQKTKDICGKNACQLPNLGGHNHGQFAKEENALKAKLRRLCEMKSGGRLQVPEWLHNEWKNGDHMKLARQFEACNFSKETNTQTYFFLSYVVNASKCQYPHMWPFTFELPDFANAKVKAHCTPHIFPDRITSSSTRKRPGLRLTPSRTTWEMAGTQRRIWPRF